MSELIVGDVILQYLSEARIMQLATVREGQPWVCNLHFTADEKGYIYWLSKTTRRHSEEIAYNSNVAAAVAVKTEKPLIGIQIEGIAEIVEDSDLLRSAMERYIELHGTDRAFAEEIISGNDEHKLYKLTPKLFSLFDQVNFAHRLPVEWVPDLK